MSAGRALFVKDAALVPTLAFLFGSTNLAPPVAALAWIFLGWQFALALVVGSVAHVAVMWLVVHLTYPKKMVENAKRNAQKAAEGRFGMHGDPTEGLPRHWREKVQSAEARYRIGITYRGEWGMVGKDLFFGFLVAGIVATLVPDSVFQAIFPTELPPLLLVPLHALLGPALAILTIIGSMSNGPLAAVLWENGVLFSGIVAFLYADFVVIPSLRINATYYGWRFAFYLAAVFAISAVGAGVIMHALFSALSLIPETEAGRVQELAQFEIDYVFSLNIAALAVSGVLVWLGRRRHPQQQAQPQESD